MGKNQTLVVDFKVAKIVDEYTVVINGGSNNGIEVGDKFEIFDPGSEVYDPDTKELLGTLNFTKAIIVAKSVYPKMTSCSSVDVASLALKALAVSLGPKTTELNVASEEISGGYDETIRVGDLVRRVHKPQKELSSQEDL